MSSTIKLSIHSYRRHLLHHHQSFSSFSLDPRNQSKPKFPIPHYAGSKPIPSKFIPSLALDCVTNIITDQHHTNLADTIRPSFESQSPILLRNLLGRCDALYFWRSLEYWRVAVGEDTPVDIEIGKGYNDLNDGNNKATMLFGEYLNYLAMSMELETKQHEQDEQEGLRQQPGIVEYCPDVAYLAQNEIFHQVKNDFPIPQFCQNGEYNVGEGKLYQSMLWMGPRNTVSPLHFDPMDNILMQIVGWKRILLFPPDIRTERTESTWHFAGKDGNQYNTSAVDIENPNHHLFPHFKSLAPIPYECILGPGDGVYIPKRWWHHVRSLEMSISANVWWR